MWLKTFLTAVLLISLLRVAPATDWYVATNGTGGGTSWANATNNLQGIITNPSVLAGDTIWVSNGVYAAGGVTNYPSGTVLTNRIAITKAITVRSKDNNPTNTIIKGAWDSPGTTNGPAAVRCVYMVASSTMIGFTLTNGATLTTGTAGTYDRRGGGVCCPDATPVISNCIIIGNSAFGEYNTSGGGGAHAGTLRNCTLINNSSYQGGGTWNSTLYDCTLISNFATTAIGIYAQGGGVMYGILSNCTLIGNAVIGPNTTGGAGSQTTMYNCTLTGNRSDNNAGGTYYSFLYNCKLTGNYASSGYGGGAHGPPNMTLYNCILAGNSALYGGGASDAKLYNCTVVSNYSGSGGGGVYNGTLSNCVVYLNSAGNTKSNWAGGCTFVYSCTASNAAGAGNITDNPMFVDTNSGNYRLAARSPCINAGTNLSWMANSSVTSRDLDGRQRIRYGTVDMGAYEHIRAGTIYGVR